MVLEAIFPSATGLKKEGGALIRGGALNTENTVFIKRLIEIYFVAIGIETIFTEEGKSYLKSKHHI